MAAECGVTLGEPRPSLASLRTRAVPRAVFTAAGLDAGFSLHHSDCDNPVSSERGKRSPKYGSPGGKVTM